MVTTPHSLRRSPCLAAMRRGFAPLALLVAAATLACVGERAPGDGPEGTASRGRPASGSGAAARQTRPQLPLAFEANRGQTDPQVRFVARGSGFGLYLTATEAVLALLPPVAERREHEPRPGTARPPPIRREQEILRLKLAGANAAPRVTARDPLRGRVNYFIGSDPAGWRTDIPTFAEVEYRDVYPGIDMVYYGNQGQLEYDLVVAPGASPGAIALGFEGPREVRIDSAGALVLKMGSGAVTMRKPVLYQEIGGSRRSVEGGYRMTGARQVGFTVGEYDRTKPLVIDPVLVYSTFLGAGLVEFGRAIAVDAAGNAYVTGVTYSSQFPTAGQVPGGVGGGPDVFVSKLDPSGSVLLYSTYLGGNGQDQGRGIAVDGAGSAYVTGDTDSGSFPVMNAYDASLNGSNIDAFVARLSPAGNALVYSTYLGTITPDEGKGIAVDAAGSAYVTGYTYWNTFPTLNPAQAGFGGAADAFVTRFTPTGALVYSTFLGGSNYDYGYGIAVDGAGNAYVTGWTASTDFPVATAAQPAAGGGGDAFVARLNASGTTFTYATYLGGSSTELGLGIAVDAGGAASVTGYTHSASGFPLVNAAQPAFGGGNVDAFAARLTPAGTAFTFATYLGGSDDDDGAGIAVDAAGNVFVAGSTPSPNFPTMGPLQGTFGGGVDVFVVKLAPMGALGFSTFLGGSSADQAGGIAVDGQGSIYLTGRTYSGDFPTVVPYQPTYAGNGDAFVAKIALPPPCVNPPNTTMVAWYPFDETAGSTAANLATGNPGTLANAPTHVPGKVAGGLEFDGIDDVVTAPSTLVTEIGPAAGPAACSGAWSSCQGNFTIDAWINVAPASAGSVQTIVDKRSASPVRGYSFFVYGGNRLGLQLADGMGSQGYSNYLSPVMPLASAWHHVAVTVTRQSPSGIRWYRDGINIGSSNPTQTGNTRYGSLASGVPLSIGGGSWGGSRFKGTMDELEIFNRALTPAELSAMYQADSSGKCK